jgi:hypothetical protein
VRRVEHAVLVIVPHDGRAAQSLEDAPSVMTNDEWRMKLQFRHFFVIRHCFASLTSAGFVI